MKTKTTLLAAFLLVAATSASAAGLFLNGQKDQTELLFAGQTKDHNEALFAAKAEIMAVFLREKSGILKSEICQKPDRELLIASAGDNFVVMATIKRFGGLTYTYEVLRGASAEDVADHGECVALL
jgi:hypothetical protein